MNYLQLSISLVLIYLSLAVIVAWYRGILTRQNFTYIPFCGGLLGCLGLYINPVCELGYWILLPLLLDYYSVPHCILSFVRHIIRKYVN